MQGERVFGSNFVQDRKLIEFASHSQTYCANTQVADSACSATAYLTGVKANYATLGVTAAVQLGDCLAENNTANHVDSIIAWAQKQGKATGELELSDFLKVECVRLAVN